MLVILYSQYSVLSNRVQVNADKRYNCIRQGATRCSKRTCSFVYKVRNDMAVCQRSLSSSIMNVFAYVCVCRQLDSNSLICDCGLMWLSDMLKDGHLQAAVTCDQPSTMAGKQFAQAINEIKCRESINLRAFF